MKICIVIGAGASFGARPDFVPRLPMGPDLLTGLKSFLSRLADNKFPEINKIEFSEAVKTRLLQLKEELTKSPLEKYENYEGLLKHLHSEFSRGIFGGADTADSLRLLAAVYFLSYNSMDLTQAPFRTSCDDYDKLAAKISAAVTGGHQITIVSLNYDILMEEALERASITYSYSGIWGVNGSDFSDAGVKIFKPHGSCNWRLVNPAHGEAMRLEQAESLRGSSVNGTVCAQNRYTALYDTITNNELPVMADYCSKKTSPIGQSTLDTIRAELAAQYSEFNEIHVTGVKPVFDAEIDTLLAETIFSSAHAHKTTVHAVNVSGPDMNILIERGFKVTENAFAEFLESFKA